jgi:hypothetical protein
MSKAARLDAHLRVAGAETRDRPTVLAQPLESLAEEPGIAFVESLQAIDGRGRIVEGLRLEGFRGGDGKDRVCRDSCVHGVL